MSIDNPIFCTSCGETAFVQVEVVDEFTNPTPQLYTFKFKDDTLNQRGSMAFCDQCSAMINWSDVRCQMEIVPF